MTRKICYTLQNVTEACHWLIKINQLSNKPAEVHMHKARCLLYIGKEKIFINVYWFLNS